MLAGHAVGAAARSEFDLAAVDVLLERRVLIDRPTAPVPPYGAPPLREELVRPPRTMKGKEITPFYFNV
jgi:hypothetical protein